MKTVTTSVAFQSPSGVVAANGFLAFTLQQNASIIGGGLVYSNVPVFLRLDANGLLIAGQQLWCSDEFVTQIPYTVDLQDSNRSRLDSYGPWLIVGASPIDISLMVATSSGVSFPGAVLLNPPGNALQTINGPLSVPAFTMKSLNALTVVMADQYANVQAAISALPSGGGVVDARSPSVNLALGALDAGSNSKPVTLLLGPFTYTFTQITVRQGFNILGAGLINTTLSNVGTNANPAFVIPQVNNNEIIFHWSDFQVTALAGNTSQDGIFFDGSSLTFAGVELGTFMNMQLTGFKGAGIHLKSTLDGASGSVGAIQGLTFVNVTSIRPTGATGATQNALRIEGGCGQIEFINCWFTGASSDTGTNVFIGTSSTQAPYSIHFHGTTNQNGFAYTIDGGTSITFDNDHFEVIKGCWNLLNTSQLLVGINIKTPHVNANVAVNSGNGYVITIPNTVTNCEVVLDTPLIYGTPDKLVNNLAGNSASVKVLNARTFNSSTPANVFSTVGVTGTLNAAATVDLKGWSTVQVNASATSMTTFKSTLQPGESVTLYATGGTIQFATGGNISIGSNVSPLIVASGDSVTFTRVDAGTPVFVLTGYSPGGANAVKINATLVTDKTGTGKAVLDTSPTIATPVINGTPTGTGIPTITFKKGTGGGNYTSASTTDVAVDGTNLSAAITIPTGWKLAILASGSISSLTAIATVFVGIADGGTVVLTQPVQPVGVGNFSAFSLAWEINGDGNSHTVDLRYHTSAGADSVTINNASSTQLPTMIFILTPSN